MARYSGRLLMGTALLHGAVGVAIYARPLADIGRAGLLNAVDPHWDRNTAFWYLSSGGLLFLLGQMTDWAERRGDTPPPSLGGGLVVLGAVGAILMPISGFWAIIAQGIALLVAARRAAGGPRIAARMIEGA